MADAQTVKRITVSQDTAYTDRLTMKDDAPDMDLMVNFTFEEDSNRLTVSLNSRYRLFVFWDQVRFRPTFKRRMLRPKMLPYEAQYGKDDRFKITRLFKYTIPKPRKKFAFNRWCLYEGLIPTPQEYRLVNDCVSQTFDIQNKRDQVSITLRDILVLDNTGYTNYEIMFGRDLFTQYEITIQRNPCYGKEDEHKRVQDLVNNITAAFNTFTNRYGSGRVDSEAGLKVFNEMKALLVSQYPRHDTPSDCQDIQDLWDSYNRYADYLSHMTCEIGSDDDSMGGNGADLNDLSPRELLLKARQIDQTVSKWLNSQDIVERRDLLAQGENLVNDGNKLIKTQTVHTREQKRAVSVFRQAENYYWRICRKGMR